MSAAGYVLVGLGVTGAAILITARIVLRRKLASEAYQNSTVARMNTAAWRRHDNVTYQDTNGYTYTPHKPQHPKGGGSDAQLLGVVTGASLAGGKGSRNDLPCKYCGTVGGHTGQCPTISATPKSRGTLA